MYNTHLCVLVQKGVGEWTDAWLVSPKAICGPFDMQIENQAISVSKSIAPADCSRLTFPFM